MTDLNELEHALKIIKNTCKENRSCGTCPLRIPDKSNSQDFTCCFADNKEPKDLNIIDPCIPVMTIEGDRRLEDTCQKLTT